MSFVAFISWEKIIPKVIPMISFIYNFLIVVVVWTLLLFYIQNNSELLTLYSYHAWCEQAFSLVFMSFRLRAYNNV